MDINRNNYEIFFIDYYDGKLSDEEINKLMAFISINNDLENEFYEFNTIKLKPDNVRIQKSILKKTHSDFYISKNNIDNYCIAQTEGDLLPGEKKIFDKYIDLNPESKKLLSLYQKIKFEPDLSVIYTEKSKLKQYKINRRISGKSIYRYISAAVVVFIVISFFNNITNKNNIKTLQEKVNFASNHNNIIKPKIQKNSFSIVKTETPSIVSQSITKTHKPTKKTNKKNVAKYQYIDKNQAIFISDLIKNTTNYSTSNKYRPGTKHITNNKIENNNTGQNSSNITNTKIVYISPKQISVVSGELNSEDFINNILNNINIDTEKQHNTQKTKKITFWDIAETGIKGYGLITGKKIDLKKEYDNRGKLASLNINSKKFSFSKKLRK